MKTLTHNRHEIKIYDSVEELPINRFQDFNRWLMLDAGIGSDAESINLRLGNIAKLLNLEEKNEALKEVANLSQSMAFVMSKLSPEFNAFICLCDSINGKKVNDLSDEGIKGYIEILSRTKVPIWKVREWLEEAKKKLTAK